MEFLQFFTGTKRARITPSLRYHLPMDLRATAEAPSSPQLKDRQDIPDRFKWNLAHIFADWREWQAAYDELETKIAGYAALQGTLNQGCLLYTSPSPRDGLLSRMPSSA